MRLVVFQGCLASIGRQSSITAQNIQSLRPCWLAEGLIFSYSSWQGHAFIDRDPKHFGLILNFLRDGLAVLPRDEQALREIMVEAAYYKVSWVSTTCLDVAVMHISHVQRASVLCTHMQEYEILVEAADYKVSEFHHLLQLMHITAFRQTHYAHACTNVRRTGNWGLSALPSSGHWLARE
jgi:hypothetical protein